MKERERSSTLWVGILLTTLIPSVPGADSAGPLPRTAESSPLPAMGARVVSYLTGATDSPEPWFPDPPLDATPYDWRIFDPATGRDFSYLRLPGSPSRIRWDRTFRFVEFKIGRRVYRAPWGPDAEASVVVELPVDSTICDFWRDDDDASWNFVSVRLLGDRLVRDGSVFEVGVAERWKSRDREGRWTRVQQDSCWEVSCSCAAGPAPVGDSDRTFTIEALQDSMRIYHHPYRGVRAATENPNADSIVTVPVSGIPGARLEFAQGFGDSDHAMLPMVFVNERQGIRRTICGDDTAWDFGQIGFQQEGRYLLVAGEFYGGDACVADLGTGEIVFCAPSQARWSVWTPWPR